jgi:hypothetical protein
LQTGLAGELRIPQRPDKFLLEIDHVGLPQNTEQHRRHHNQRNCERYRKLRLGCWDLQAAEKFHEHAPDSEVAQFRLHSVAIGRTTQVKQCVPLKRDTKRLSRLKAQKDCLFLLRIVHKNTI